jgi:hypothetical protein
MKRAGVFAIVSVAAAFAGIAFACGPNPIPIATIEVDAGRIKCDVVDAGDGGGTCPAGQFCSRTTSCGANDGYCEVMMSDDCADSGPQCGCDRVNYYNSCVRQNARASLASPGQCDGRTLAPNPCLRPEDCHNVNASCALVFPFTPEAVPQVFDTLCPAPGTSASQLPSVGTCWALPDEATCAASGSRLEGCAKQCISDCSAIRGGGVYFLCPTADASTD